MRMNYNLNDNPLDKLSYNFTDEEEICNGLENNLEVISFLPETHNEEIINLNKNEEVSDDFENENESENEENLVRENQHLQQKLHHFYQN